MKISNMIKDIMLHIATFLQPCVFCIMGSTCKRMLDVIKSSHFNKMISKEWFGGFLTGCIYNFPKTKHVSLFSCDGWTRGITDFYIKNGMSPTLFTLEKKTLPEKKDFLVKKWKKDDFLPFECVGQFKVPVCFDYLLNDDGLWTKKDSVLSFVDFNENSLFLEETAPRFNIVVKSLLDNALLDKASLNPTKEMFLYSDFMNAHLYDIETGKLLHGYHSVLFADQSSPWRSNHEIIFLDDDNIFLHDVKTKRDEEQYLYKGSDTSSFERIQDYLIILEDNQCLTVDIRMPQKAVASFPCDGNLCTDICIINKSFLIIKEDEAFYSEIFVPRFRSFPWVGLREIRPFTNNIFIGTHNQKEKLYYFEF